MQESNVKIEEIQEKLLTILLYFKEFCEKHDLKFILAGGTCLGAIRHQGFIPWDDDIDVFMLRDDYEKLQGLWEKFADTNRYSYLRSNDKVNIRHSATEIKDNNTTFINRHSVDLDIHQGLMIDIIPLDGVAQGKIAQFYQIIQGMLYCGFNFQRLPDHKGKFIYYTTKIALAIFKSDSIRYKIWKHAEQQLSKFSISKHKRVASFGEGVSIMRQRFPKEWFLEPEYVKFEGYDMPVPADVDAYLKISYGNYMQLPPEKERIARHNTVFIDLDNSYKVYRKIKYFVKED